VSARSIQQLAEIYAESEPALIRCGWGLERNRNGGQAVAAVLALPALLGKFGVRGGGYTMSNSGAYAFDRQRLIGEVEEETRSLNMTQLGRWLDDGLELPVKGLFVYNANPVATVPDQNAVLRGLGRPDLFTVVFDQVLTDTAAYADLLLPAVTFLEGNDLVAGYGSYAFGGTQQVIAPRGEARSNPAVFAELGRAMGWSDTPFQWSEEELLLRAVEAIEVPGSCPPYSRARPTARCTWLLRSWARPPTDSWKPRRPTSRWLSSPQLPRSARTAPSGSSPRGR